MRGLRRVGFVVFYVDNFPTERIRLKQSIIALRAGPGQSTPARCIAHQRFRRQQGTPRFGDRGCCPGYFLFQIDRVHFAQHFACCHFITLVGEYFENPAGLRRSDRIGQAGVNSTNTENTGLE